MEETKLALQKSVSITLDATGAGIAYFTVGANERWRITLLNTNGNSSPECELFVRRRSNGQQLDYTNMANGAPSNTDIEVQQGDAIVVDYQSGNSGAIMNFSLEGELYVRGKRGY